MIDQKDGRNRTPLQCINARHKELGTPQLGLAPREGANTPQVGFPAQKGRGKEVEKWREFIKEESIP
jgi:hypothetical protein